MGPRPFEFPPKLPNMPVLVPSFSINTILNLGVFLKTLISLCYSFSSFAFSFVVPSYGICFFKDSLSSVPLYFLATLLCYLLYVLSLDCLVRRCIKHSLCCCHFMLFFRVLLTYFGYLWTII